ncbi:phosphate ABC transporter permease PstA [candidate division KSB3 bacterium]|uniref:Phosphate transport system permease protein PstA n=1 Tax=candidate division KSB3 bacterium TaxID=2044937 RepID=A0A9D5K0N0_9BACT|nr:phosphate ABC transporter permease PstA [candidate division KSB3 bacterium]MBD3327470.1 phosphate ABC transporter permease PstA [candidate division KSB3 bacterium]
MPEEIPYSRSRTSLSGANLTARGEPFLWGMGGALVVGICMIFGFLLLIFWNGIITFYPKSIAVVTLKDSGVVAGEPFRSEVYRPTAETLDELDQASQQMIQANQGIVKRVLYRTGNFDLYNEDFTWVPDYAIQDITTPTDIYFLERTEWGPFIGFITSITLNEEVLSDLSVHSERLYNAHQQAKERRERIREIEREEIGAVNYQLERKRLELREKELEYGKESQVYQEALAAYQARSAELEQQYAHLQAKADALKAQNEQYQITLADVNGQEKTLLLSDIIRFYPANALSLWQKIGVYVSRWYEFLTQNPREANTEGGVFPAIFGTFVMTVLMAVAVAPFGVMAALYLREYAKQGRLVSAVRICVNNLAGVPSIVYGVFGLGFFAYILGAGIDHMFFPERLPNPTFGTGGILWASLTLALLTVPVVIVATEEALAAVPKSLREGSLACGASKWQTIKYIVLPKALPGIMTGLILAMARGAGEVAPLMLVGVVKIAPKLPIDQFFPFVHLERSFMHLGFHIFDVGFQSRNSEAGKPMVFVTTLLLITLVAVMNAVAIYIRNRLKKKYYVGHF